MEVDALGDLWSWITYRAELSPDRPLAFDEHDGRLDFGEFHARAERVAAGLIDAGVRSGTRVAWILPTRLDALVLSGALARLGCEQVPLMPSLGQRELGFVLTETRPDQVIDLATDLPEADPAQLAGCIPSQGDPVRWIFYTSGTTSKPKGVMHTDASLLGAAIGLDAPHRFSADDRVSLVFPYAHIGGPTLLVSALRVGHALILVEKFDPTVVVETLARHGVTLAGSGPAFWQVFIAAQRAEPGRRVFPQLRALIGGGAAKPAHLHAEARDVLGVPIVSGYGSTECPGLSYNHVGDSDEVLRTDGRAVAGVEIRIVAGDGPSMGPDPNVAAEAAVGEVGEIRVRGPMLCRGYLGDEQLPLDDDGFFRTGDLGRLDADGQLVVSGRIKDIIIRKGENISAKEVEDLLGAHPSIAEIAVVGLPDRERGERCCAVVVPSQGVAPLTLQGLTAYCRQAGLTRFKHPEQLEVVEALPLNETGKVLKSELRERFGGSRR